MNPIQPFLSFTDNNAEEAARFYLSVFKNSREVAVNRTKEAWGPFKAGDVIDVEIKKLDEQSGTAAVSLEQTPLVVAGKIDQIAHAVDARRNNTCAEGAFQWLNHLLFLRLQTQSSIASRSSGRRRIFARCLRVSFSKST